MAYGLTLWFNQSKIIQHDRHAFFTPTILRLIWEHGFLKMFHVVKAYLILMTLSLKVNHFFIITYFFVYLATENFLCSAVYCIG